jgi:hypothetical protein
VIQRGGAHVRWSKQMEELVGTNKIAIKRRINFMFFWYP